MSPLPPNTIRVSGDRTDDINNIPAGIAICPGYLVEQYAFGAGLNRWRPNTAAADVQKPFVALDSPEWNHSLTPASLTSPLYAIGDLVPVWPMEIGDLGWLWILSGQNIANSDYLQSAGDGTLKKATATTAAANVVQFQSMENPGAVTVPTRIVVQRVA